MVKHSDYDKDEMIQLSRLGEDKYRLFYEAENYEFIATKEEVLEELSEHMELKKF
jgi:RNase P/RNase MRP subunit p30